MEIMTGLYKDIPVGWIPSRFIPPASPSFLVKKAQENAGIGLAIGVALGLIVGLLIDNIGLGIALGAAFGLVCGSGFLPKKDEF